MSGLVGRSGRLKFARKIGPKHCWGLWPMGLVLIDMFVLKDYFSAFRS